MMINWESWNDILEKNNFTICPLSDIYLEIQ